MRERKLKPDFSPAFERAIAEVQRQHFPVLGTLQLVILRRNYVRFRT